MHGVTARELHAEHHHPEQLPALEAAIQTNTRREPVAATLAAHEHHDQNIRQAVEALHHDSAASSGDPVSRGRTIRPVIPVEEAEQWDS